MKTLYNDILIRHNPCDITNRKYSKNLYRALLCKNLASSASVDFIARCCGVLPWE